MRGPRSGPSQYRHPAPSLAYFYSAPLAWNPTGVDKQATGPAVLTDQLDRIPKHLASIWAMKSIPLGTVRLRGGAGVRYVSDSFSTGTNADGPFSLVTPEYVLADALLGVDLGSYQFTVNATNLFDKRYLTSCLGRGDCYVGVRRTVVARLGYRF